MIVILLLILGLLAYFIIKHKNTHKFNYDRNDAPPDYNFFKPDEPRNNNNDYKPVSIPKDDNDIFPYHKKLLLTQNEYYFYKRLKESISAAKNIQILAKIRLADIIEVNYGLSKQEWGKYFSKIKSKHIDFAIAQDMKILILIELDDNSHNSEKREKRDDFVEKALKAADFKLIRTYGDISQIEKELYKLRIIPSMTNTSIEQHQSNIKL